jgi:hypothetical protein
MLTVQSVSPEIKVFLTATPPSVRPATLVRVEEIWQAELVERDRALFNGRLFSIETAKAGRITGWLAEYKWFLAQRRDANLEGALRVRPLAVTGLLLCLDGVVFGRRAGHVEQDAGLWELVPAGGIDGSAFHPDGSIDLAHHLIAELFEETGISNEMLDTPPQPFAIVCDSGTHVSDIGIFLRTKLSKARITSTFATLHNREYVALEVVPVTHLPAFVRCCGGALAPVSCAFLDAAKSLLFSA